MRIGLIPRCPVQNRGFKLYKATPLAEKEMLYRYVIKTLIIFLLQECKRTFLFIIALYV